jgi:hypothetical protein
MPEYAWDFQVVPINLDYLNIDAEQRLGIVIVQPEYELEPEGEIPLRISEAYRDAQKALIEQAFQIRLEESRERGVSIPFILFPEAAIPMTNPDGLDWLRQQMEQAEDDIVFIGGLEGMTCQQTRILTTRFSPIENAAKPDFMDGTYVNVCVIAVKSASGPVIWHFQAKLIPSQWEQPRNMARGKRVLYFRANGVAFLCQICFDIIAAQGAEHLNSVLCQKLVSKTEPNAAPLDFLFVPQYNPASTKNCIKENMRNILTFQDRLLKNDGIAVVMANKAARTQESSEYGRSGLHYKAGRWQVQKRDIGPKGYELYEMDGVASAVFRKRTPAIHLATLVPPVFNVQDPGNPRLPLENVRSYALGDPCDSPACSYQLVTRDTIRTFIECDCLPCKLRDSLLLNLPNDDNKRRWSASNDGQSSLLASHYAEIRQRILTLSGQRVANLLDLLFLFREGGKRNPDMWKDSEEVDAIRELAAAMSVLREHGQIDFDTQVQWTAIIGSNISIAALDGEAKNDCHELINKYLDRYSQYRHEVRARSLLVVALRSTGRAEPIIERFQPDRTRPRFQRGNVRPSPYEPAQIHIFICRDDLFQEAKRAPSLMDFIARAMGNVGV